ncbi:GNAT family N-acetyltransferase [Nocardia asteroides]|uniref:GNAT family N-acetyltransferase n=1 Tax=Nocardia asteroides TaxID=1824 RepID=UPI001E485153|nr:GNAT family N-acetyltransferase [Nocardia asteroides]UGT63624.1 GNAT family N-acetyltransferase [Nocardia asteroides]
MISTVALKRSWAQDLDTATLYELLKLRVEIFVVEQKCAYPELDGRDLLPETRHLWLDDEGTVIATLRLLEEHEDGVKSFRIGRLCTARPVRGQGYTTRLLQAALAEVGSHPVRLNAQSHLVELYAKHGFTAEGPEFVEDGIPHTPMRRG